VESQGKEGMRGCPKLTAGIREKGGLTCGQGWGVFGKGHKENRGGSHGYMPYLGEGMKKVQ